MRHEHANFLPDHRCRRQARRRGDRHDPLLRARGPAARAASGYRSYGEGTVAQLRFIRRAKDLGFTLEEIRELLALSVDRQRGVKAVKQRAEKRLAAIEQRIVELQRVRDGLAQLVASCPGHGKPEECPILRALSDEQVSA